MRNYFRACGRFASVYEIVQNNGPLAEHIVRTYRSHRGVTKNDLQTMVTKLVNKVKTERATAIDERHLVELMELLRAITAESQAQEEQDRRVYPERQVQGDGMNELEEQGDEKEDESDDEEYEDGGTSEDELEMEVSEDEIDEW